MQISPEHSIKYRIFFKKKLRVLIQISKCFVDSEITCLQPNCICTLNCYWWPICLLRGYKTTAIKIVWKFFFDISIAFLLLPCVNDLTLKYSECSNLLVSNRN
jgi:hypothetical protein